VSDLTDRSDPSDPTDAKDRAQRIRQLVNACVQRRARGESVSDQSLIQANRDLLPELAEELRNLRLIEHA
jgi:hypothetical protein